ncbi:hypothetical protein STANM309S_05350 [Streptomyces tanashiensis]
MHQLLHNRHTVINTCKDDSLIPYRNTGIHKTFARFFCFFCDFNTCIEMGVQPNWVIFFQNLAQLICNTLRKDNRRAGSNPNDFNVRNIP